MSSITKNQSVIKKRKKEKKEKKEKEMCRDWLRKKLNTQKLVRINHHHHINYSPTHHLLAHIILFKQLIRVLKKSFKLSLSELPLW